MNSKKDIIVSGFLWKALEQYSVIGIQFVLQIILARLLEPKAYGVISIVTVFLAISNVFIQNGFAVALVQQKEVDEIDLSSVFYFTFAVATILYSLIFISAPFVADYFSMIELTMLLRVMSIILFIGAVNSIQNALLRRRMQFKLTFISSFISVMFSGTAGIVCALNGMGVWALAIQQILYYFLVMVTLMFGLRWCPKAAFKFERIKSLLSFGWKVLVSGLIDEFFAQLRSLIIGRKYDGTSLAYFTRGRQFPDLLMKSINGSLQAVLLPVLSKEQDNKVILQDILRKTVRQSTFIMFPILTGLAIVAPSMVSVMLTDKWMPCVVFIQIFCIYYLTWAH